MQKFMKAFRRRPWLFIIILIYTAGMIAVSIPKSMELTEAQQSELGRLGGLLHAVSHEVGHFYTGLEFLPKALRDELEDYYGHGH